MKKTLWFIFLLLGINTFANPADTLKANDKIYDKPFINIPSTTTSIGGYAEGNTNYFAEDGVTEGISFEMRRFNVFLFSAIHPRIKLLSELEFEHGTEEIALEIAMIDFEIHPLLIFRGGIILAPIGGNANHDSPKWEFIERPLVSTQIIPSTLSEVGFGVLGDYQPGNNLLSYEVYLVNGLQDGVIFNQDGKTLLLHGKNAEMFEEDNNGVPMYTGKFTLKNFSFGEIGISYYGGVYNSFQIEGSIVEQKRNLSVIAFDLKTTLLKKIIVHGEFAQNNIDVPTAIEEIYGSKQWGYYAEINYPFIERSVLRFEKAKIFANLRFEKVDYNNGTFAFTGAQIFDDVTALAAGISFRPVYSTVIKANYRYHRTRDLVGNPVFMAGFQFGLATYF